MSDLSPTENEFLKQINAVVEENISNEQFGVTELADKMNMSRSNLLRKVKKSTKLSVSQLISQVRLGRGMELLKTSSYNVSEVSHQVGFSSTSYFIKCFREYYGYPPGEVGKKGSESAIPTQDARAIGNDTKWNRKFGIVGTSLLVVMLAIGLFVYYSKPMPSPNESEKSIAVLPFKNESNDSTNIYLINGLMESTLTNLQKIENLKVISRTSVERYRSTSKSIPEMAKELNVKYFVEGSGQKIGDKILLNIQLIEGATDKHLWANQYRREAKDIFELQQEIAKTIADEIQVAITPEAEKKIEKKPTDNLVAYDLYLKGKDLFYKSKRKELEESVIYFKKAVELDDKFALAYATGAMVFYYLDIFQKDKKHSIELTDYANKAIEYDPNLVESLIAEALSYASKGKFELAVSYLEKALEEDPNSGLVVHFLTEFYSLHLSNPGKYLAYALQGVRIDREGFVDSATTGFKYFHLSNAMAQAGFMEEALLYVDKSITYNANGFFSRFFRIFVLYASNRNLPQAKDLLIQELRKDTTRLDIMQEVGKVCYVMQDYKSAYAYYKKFLAAREMMQLDIYRNENLKIGMVLSKIGQEQKGKELIENYKSFADNDQTIYKNLYLAEYYSYQRNFDKAIEHLKQFSKEDNYSYWVLLLEEDPVIEPIKNSSEFKKVMGTIKSKFWARREALKELLRDNKLEVK
jgi:TolB-like protein/AraC-like DNA-binding protein